MDRREPCCAVQHRRTGPALRAGPRLCTSEQQSVRMRHTVPFVLHTIAIVLLVLWLLGMVSSTTIGGFVHVLLVLAIVIVLLRVIQGRRAFGG
jgi:hypothetical protein